MKTKIQLDIFEWFPGPAWFTVATALIVSTAAPAFSNEFTPEFCMNYQGSEWFKPGMNAGIPGAGGVSLHDGRTNERALIRVFLNDDPNSNAVCNDGSPAVMYVRRAPQTIDNRDNPNQDKWHMHLKGGGYCQSFETCAARWCHAPGNILNQAGLMSSHGTHERTRGKGIFLDHPDNEFASYNQVLMFYCSSDSWIGNSPSKPNLMVSHDPIDRQLSEEQKLRTIQFRGAEIVNEAFDALEIPGGLTYFNDRLRQFVQLPELDSAALFLLTGDSAGAEGVRQHLDRIRDRLVDRSSAIEPPVVLGALDAGGAVDFSSPLFNWNNSATAINYDDYMTQQFTQLSSFHGIEATAIDESCVQLRGFGNDCIDNRLVQQYHVTTPLFLRTSLEDSLYNKNLEGNGMLGSSLDLRQLSFNGLVQLNLLPSALEDQPAEVRPPIQIMAPNCTKHVAFRNTTEYTQQRSASGATLRENLVNFVTECRSSGCPWLLDIENPVPDAKDICRGDHAN